MSLAKLAFLEYQDQRKKNQLEPVHECSAFLTRKASELKYFFEVKNSLVQGLLNTDCCRTAVCRIRWNYSDFPCSSPSKKVNNILTEIIL